MSLLELHGISRSYGGVKAVQRVSFNVEQGDALGLIGPNGSGKSTTVNLVCGVYPVDEGKIIFDGKKLTKKNDPKDRARMGLCRTFQTPRPFSKLSVYENVFAVALLNNDFSDARKETERVLKTIVDKYINETSETSENGVKSILDTLMKIKLSFYKIVILRDWLQNIRTTYKSLIFQ